MTTPAKANEVLDREFLTIRSRLLDVAAALDRIDRADGSMVDDPRLERIRRAAVTLTQSVPGRAEQVQIIFSLPYEENWRDGR